MQHLVYEITETGVDTMSDADLAALAREWWTKAHDIEVSFAGSDD